MSFYSTTKALNDYVGANWPGPWAIVGENVPPPTDRTKAWVRYSMRPSLTQPWDVTSSMERTIGNVWFQIFLPENTGSNEASKIADAVRHMLFEKRIVDSLGVLILTRAAVLTYVGKDPSGFMQWRCLVDYQADADPYTQ